jgi:hypothetical protein
MLIALDRGSRPRGAHHGILAGRDNHPDSRGMAHHSSVDRRFVIHAITNEPIDAAVDLRQQRRHVGRVLLSAFRHRGGNNLALGIDADVQFLPVFTLLLALFLGMPFALATDLQAAAVNDQEYWSLGHTLDLLSHLHCGIASRERRVIRARQRHAHQRQDGGEKVFRLPQR